jgi:C1A family cysteine protease
MKKSLPSILIIGIIFILYAASSFGSADIKFFQEKTNFVIDEEITHCQECENNNDYSLNVATFFLKEDVDLTLSEIQNAIHAAGVSWNAGLNSVTNVTENIIGLGCVIEKSENTYENEPVPLIFNESLPDNFSWQDIEGVNWVTSARDQQSCGSCVAFGTISALESVVQIELGHILDLDLSEAHLFYCGGGSCSNGWTVSKSVKYLETYGVPEESCFPYTPVQTDCVETCPDWQTQAIKIIDGVRIRSYPPAISDVQKALIEHGPLVTTFTVYNDFFYYNSGIYEHVHGDVAGGHAVAIVGYDNINEYWICKNSWGKNWGENGFFRIKYGECGLGSVFNTYYLTGVSGGICEQYLPSTLENPYPVNNAANIVTNPTLTWEGGDPNPEDTVYYELYFGNNSDNLVLISTLGPFTASQKGISYDLKSLNLESNYFWQVIAIDSDNSRRIGPIWHFSTLDLIAPDLEIITPIAGFMYTDHGDTRKQIPSDRAVIYGPITVELYVFDKGSGIQKVDIFVDNKLKASLTNQPFEWYWNTLSIGNHELTIKAVDYSGNQNEKSVDVQTYISKSTAVTNTLFSRLIVKLFD